MCMKEERTSPNSTSKIMGLINTSQKHDFGVMIGSFIKISVQCSVAVGENRSNVKARITREETAEKQRTFLCCCVNPYVFNTV